MKIAFFTDVFEQLNGVTTHVRSFAKNLAERGNDVKVYTYKTNEKPDGYEIIGLSSMPFFLNKEYRFVLPKFFPHYRLPFDADIVHVHTPYIVGLLGLWMARRNRVPCVTTTHTAAKNMTKRPRLERLAWRYLRWFYNKFDRVICQTSATEAYFRKRGMRAPASIISAGIDYDFFARGNASNFEKKYGSSDFVLSACRLSHEKRPQWMLRACRELDIPAVIVSDGPLRRRLEREFPEVRFFGAIPRGDLRDAYAAARVVTLTSSEESEGLVVHEARAAGTPVIASALPAICEFVHDGIDGFTFNPQNFGEFRQKLKQLWEDQTLRKKFASAGSKESQDRDQEKCVLKLEKVYEGLVD
ncbi:glycosyltransferase [archaeon]|nr:glycosyltransferase [archaeon]